MLPGTHYLVRMLDGRIDAQGLVKDLRARGLLEEITSDETVEAHKEDEAAAAAATDEPATEPQTPAESASPSAEREGVNVPAKGKKPRKLIEDEHREEGSVKWRIYRTYLKASYVYHFVSMFGNPSVDVLSTDLTGLGLCSFS